MLKPDWTEGQVSRLTVELIEHIQTCLLVKFKQYLALNPYLIFIYPNQLNQPLSQPAFSINQMQWHSNWAKLTTVIIFVQICYCHQIKF